MIRYSLACEASHVFEAWFASSNAYEKQRNAGSVACPVCNSTSVEKELMAPAVATARAKDARQASRYSAHVPDKETAEAVAALRKLREHLTQNAEYVGPRFAEEARRIHYDESEKRGIYGEASVDDVRSLAEEGIEFHPLPVLPEEHN